jgi:hypothetical protein
LSRPICGPRPDATDLQARNLAPQIIQALIDGLRKAGLYIPKAGT